MTKAEVKARIHELGIVPAIRVSSEEDALFAAEAVSSGGIAIVEVTTTVPNALEVIALLREKRAEMVVGAGTVLDTATAERAIAAGAHFLTSPNFDSKVMAVGQKAGVTVIPGALTPTEICDAWKAGADFVKVFPCGQMGGPHYIRALRGPFPEVPLIAAGGVTQQTAGDHIRAGAAALGIGTELIPHEAIKLRQPDWIQELAHRFLGMVKAARVQAA